MYGMSSWDFFAWMNSSELKKKILNACEPVLYPFSKRFFGGRIRREALLTVKELNRRKRKAVVNFLGEHVTDPKEIRAHVREYTKLLRDISDRRLDATVSLKLTQIGLDLSRDICEFNLETILQEAKRKNVGVEVDMEDPWYVDDTIAIVAKLAQKYSRLRLALQANLIRTRDDLERVLDTGNIRVRLCKGAYEKPREQFHGNSLEARLNFLMLASTLFNRSDYPAIATHDEELLDIIERRFKNKPPLFEFQMLYGMRKDLEARILRQGHTLRIYVPYGRNWLHYGMRRWRSVARILLRRS